MRPEFRQVETIRMKTFSVKCYRCRETRQGRGLLYIFALFEGIRHVRSIVVEWHDFSSMDRQFFLEETFQSGKHMTYESYGAEAPEYDRVKKKVWEVLSRDK